MLANARKAREPPLFFTVDEQNAPYQGLRSGAKKRLAKKTLEGLEYHTIATSNKGYEGWNDEVRGPPTEQEPMGELLRAADPVSGGYKLNYIMEGGPRYEVGGTSAYKSFSILSLLIFLCGDYLRYRDSVAITDSAYGFLDCMFFLTLQSIRQITSLRMGQKRGFLKVTDLDSAGRRHIKKLKSNKRKSKKSKKVANTDEKIKQNIKLNVSAQEKENKDKSKGTFWMWKTVKEVVRGVFTTVYLTAVRDSKIVWRLDNFLGASKTKNMEFQDYVQTDSRKDIKQKQRIVKAVPKVHWMYRNYMGFVDQSDVKSRVMGLCREKVTKWAQKQLAFLVEAAIICSNGNYNLETRFTAEFFTEYHNQLCEEFLELSKNYRSYKSPKKRKARNENLPNPKRRRSHRPRDITAVTRRRGVPEGTVTEVGLNCRARDNLMRNIRYSPIPGTDMMQRVKCAFCGRSRTLYSCKLCDAHLCMKPPVHLLVPGSDPPRHFRADGLWCVHRWHGFTKWTDLDQLYLLWSHRLNEYRL